MAQVTGVNTTWNTTAGNKSVAPTPNTGEVIVAITAHSGITTGVGVDDNQPGGGAYTQIGSVALNNTSVDALWAFIRNNWTSPVTGHTVSTNGAGASTGGGIISLRIAGLQRVNSAVVRQFAKVENQAAGTPAVTLGQAPLATSVLIGVVLTASNSSTNTAPPAGWTEQQDAGYNTPTTGIEVATIDSGETNTTITWGAATPSGFAAIVIELDTTPPTIAIPSVRPILLRPLKALFGPIIRAFPMPLVPAVPYYAQEVGGGSVAISGLGGTNEAAGMAFPLADDVVINQVELMLSTTGTPTDDLLLEVLSGSITGTVVDSVTRSVSDLTATPGWAAFGIEVALTAGTYYLRLSRVGARDTSNRVKWERATTDLIGGLDRYSEDSSVWTSLPTEHTFRIYGPSTPTASHTFFITPSGATTPVGALLKTEAKPFAGAVTPAGTVAKVDQKTVTGATTPAGALTKRANLAKSGAATPTGALLKLVGKPFAGSTTPAGALAKRANKAFSGSTTPTGALTKLVGKLLTGSTTPTGSLTLTRVVLRAFSGATTPAGALAKLVGKVTAGSTTPAGTITKQLGVTRTGATTPAGVLTKRANKVYTGATTPTGSALMSKVVLRTFTGAVTAVGVLTKLRTKPLAGSTTPTGATSFTRVTLRVFTGAVTPVGTVVLHPVRVAKTIGAFIVERWRALGALRWTATSRDRWRP